MKNKKKNHRSITNTSQLIEKKNVLVFSVTNCEVKRSRLLLVAAIDITQVLKKERRNQGNQLLNDVQRQMEEENEKRTCNLMNHKTRVRFRLLLFIHFFGKKRQENADYHLRPNRKNPVSRRES